MTTLDAAGAAGQAVGPLPDDTGVPVGPVTAVGGFDLAMQRACGVGLMAFVVQGALQLVLAPGLYPRWWWVAVAPVFLVIVGGMVALCLRGRMRQGSTVAVVLSASACFVLTSVATADTPLFDATVVTTVAIGMAGAVGFLHPPRRAVPLGLLLLGSLAVSMALTRGQVHTDLVAVTAVGVALLLLGVVQGALARRTAAAEDEAVERLQRALVADRAAAAARADRRALERRLHDTVLNTLTALGRGSLTDSPTLRARCAADAELLRALRDGARTDPPQTDLLTGLQQVAARGSDAAFTVVVSSAPVGATVPPAVVAAFTAAAHEAVSNARRHSGAAATELCLEATDGGCAVTVLDRGRGPDLDAVHRRLGVRRSIVDRMADVGGGAEIGPAVGGGTRVRLWWPR